MALVKRLTKGSELTWSEMDGNLDELQGQLNNKSPIAGPGSSQAFAVGALTQTGTALLAQGSTDRVGIGTDAPDYKLHIHFGSASGYIGVTAKSYLSAIGNDSTGFGIISTSDTYPMYFSTNSIERMRITDSGAVLIGQTAVSTGAKLEVNGNINCAGRLELYPYTQSSAVAGGAVLPSNPVGFIEVIIGGTTRRIPYYAEA